MKKTLALILSVLMVLSVMSVMAITSSAEEEATVAAYYGKIENWSGSTFFITGLTTSDNDTVYANLKNGTYTLSVTVIDDTTGTTYYIPQYYFDTPSKEFYATSFLRLAVCEYGIVPVADHTYTVGLEVYEGSTLLYAGVSETGAFATTNEAFQNDGAIVPETVPHECVVVASVNAYYGKIENWSGSTFFIAGLTTFNNDVVYAGLKDGTYTLKVSITDDNTGATYIIPEYAFDTPSKEFYATSFLRLAVCEYGIVPVADHTYTVGMEVYEGDKLITAGVSATGAFATTNEPFQNDGAIIPETVPHSAYLEGTVGAWYGKIENWSGSTFFIAGMTTGMNDVIYPALKDGSLTLKVTLKDETAGKTYIIPEYAFDTPSKEFYATSFLRLAVCEYGIVPVAENAYTLIMEVYNGDVLVAKCESATGAYVTTNDAFIADGAIIPENVPHTYVDPDAPVVEPETPDEPAESTGDAAVYATIAVAVAAVAMAVVLKRKSTI